MVRSSALASLKDKAGNGWIAWSGFKANTSTDLQPLAWFAMGILALARLKFGKHLCQCQAAMQSFLVSAILNVWLSWIGRVWYSKGTGIAEYLLVVIVAVVLTGSNVIGFTKCSKQASKQIRAMASSAITTGLTVRIFLRQWRDGRFTFCYSKLPACVHHEGKRPAADVEETCHFIIRHSIYGVLLELMIPFFRNRFAPETFKPSESTSEIRVDTVVGFVQAAMSRVWMQLAAKAKWPWSGWPLSLAQYGITSWTWRYLKMVSKRI